MELATVETRAWYCAAQGIKQQAVDAPSRFLINGADKTKVVEKHTVLNIELETLTAAYDVEFEEKENSAEHRIMQHEKFVPCLPEVFALEDELPEPELDILNLQEFIASQTADNEGRLVEAAVVQPKQLFLYGAHGVFLWLSAVHRALEQQVTIALRSRILRLWHYHSEQNVVSSDKYTVLCDGILTTLKWKMTCTKHYVTASPAWTPPYNQGKLQTASDHASWTSRARRYRHCRRLSKEEIWQPNHPGNDA